MKFARIVLGIKSFWTAFALSLIFVIVFADRPFCPDPQTETGAFRSAAKSYNPLPPEDYAVFTAFLKQRPSFRETYVLGNTAFDAAPADALQIAGKFHQLSNETLNDYVLKNRKPGTIENHFRIRFEKSQSPSNLKSEFPVVLLSREEENEFFSKNEAGWDEFYEKYPGSGGIIHFSNVGFNAEKTEALVRVKYLCALCSGTETFYFLTKNGGQWRVQ
jgi:hypothetical protein